MTGDASIGADDGVGAERRAGGLVGILDLGTPMQMHAVGARGTRGRYVVGDQCGDRALLRMSTRLGDGGIEGSWRGWGDDQRQCAGGVERGGDSDLPLGTALSRRNEAQTWF